MVPIHSVMINIALNALLTLLLSTGRLLDVVFSAILIITDKIGRLFSSFGPSILLYTGPQGSEGGQEEKCLGAV